MQELVEQCVATGHAERLEACVLKMDLLSLDLNQVGSTGGSSLAGWHQHRCWRPHQVPAATAPLVGADLLPSPFLLQLIPLCIRHRLFAALIHIFTRALQDHQTPAALLLVAAAAASEAEAAQAAATGASAAAASAGTQEQAQALLERRESLRLAYKLLVFLRCCLLGANYPPGERLIATGAGWAAVLLMPSSPDLHLARPPCCRHGAGARGAAAPQQGAGPHVLAVQHSPLGCDSLPVSWLP